MGANARAMRGSFSPLRIRDFRIYVAGQAVSLVGVFMQGTAQAWLVWVLTGSGTALGLTVAIGFLPMLVLGPWTGVLADRFDRRRLLIATQMSAMFLAFALAALVQTRAVQLWHVYVLATLLGVVNAFDFPAQQAFVGDLTGMSEVRKAVVLNAMVVQVSRTLGPALAGALLAVWGLAVSFWINGATFLAVIATLLAVRATQVRRASTGSSIGEFREGVRFVLTQPRMQDLFLLVAIVTFFAFSSFFILPAITGVLGGGPDLLGALMGASGAGALVGTLVLTPFAQGRRRTGLVLAACIAWTGAWLVVISLSRSVPLSVAAMFASSLSIPVVMTTASGLLQFLAPPDMRARLLSMLVVVTFGAQPIAGVFTGVGADLIGPAEMTGVNGVALAVAAVAMLLLRPGLRTWEVDGVRPAPGVPAGAAPAPRPHFPPVPAARIADRRPGEVDPGDGGPPAP